MKKSFLMLCLPALLAACGSPSTPIPNTQLPQGIYQAKPGQTFHATSEGTPEYNLERINHKRTTTLSAQAYNVTYTKVANYGQSYVVPEGHYNVTLKNIYTVSGDDSPRTNSYAVTPGTVNVCGQTPYGYMMQGNEQYACYTYSEVQRPYSADKIEMFNRWDWKYQNRVRQLYGKLQINDLGYSRGEYNTEWRLWQVGYSPNPTEIQQARAWFQARGWDLNKLQGKEKAMYAMYAIYTAPDDYGNPPPTSGAGLKTNLWDEAGLNDSITVR